MPSTRHSGAVDQVAILKALICLSHAQDFIRLAQQGSPDSVDVKAVVIDVCCFCASEKITEAQNVLEGKALRSM